MRKIKKKIKRKKNDRYQFLIFIKMTQILKQKMDIYKNLF